MDKDQDISLKELYIPSKHNKKTYFCEDFIIYPENKEKYGGYLFGIVEVRATPVDESEKIIQTIINTLKQAYYEPIHSSPNPEKLNLETIFEHALQKTNSKLNEIAEIGHIKLILENLNFIIAVAKPNKSGEKIDLLFTHQGMLNAYLIHKTKQNNYKLINIIDNTPKLKEEQTDRLKIFSSTLAGEVAKNNCFYICTEIFSNYIPAHKVKKIVCAHDLSSSVDYFKSLINNVKNKSYLTYCAIFVKLEEKRSFSQKPVSEKSLDNLITTKEKTEKFLTPTFGLNLRNNLRKIINSLGANNKNKKSRLRNISQKKVKFGFFKYLKNVINILISSMIGTLKKIIRTITGQQPPKDKKNKKSSLSDNKKMNKYSKIILVVVLILILGLISSIIWTKYAKKVKQEQQEYNSKIEQSKELINNAQINLIYKDENKSLQLVKQAEELINNLPRENDNQKANYQELEQQVLSIKNKLLHITKIVPRQITEINKDEHPVKLINVEFFNDKLLVHGQKEYLYQVDPKKPQSVSSIKSQHGSLIKGTSKKNTALFITDKNTIIHLQDDKLKKRSIDLIPGENVAFTLYSENIYALNKTREQIYKYRFVQDNYGAGQKWIKNQGSADLTSATSLTIDGDIYISTEKDLYKFFRGEKQEFNLPTIEPEIKNIKKILTNAESDYIYILGQDSRRIIVISKSGQLINQYSFESLAGNIEDFTITDKLYLISENKIYKAEL